MTKWKRDGIKSSNIRWQHLPICDSERILDLIALGNLSRIMLSIISEWDWKTNAANSSWNSDSILLIRWESAYKYHTIQKIHPLPPDCSLHTFISMCVWLMAIVWCVTLSGCWDRLLRCSNHFLCGGISLLRNVCLTIIHHFYIRLAILALYPQGLTFINI